LLVEVEKLRDQVPTDAEVAKARNQFLAGTLASRKTMQGQAQDLGGSWLAAGDLNFSARYLAAVRKVSPEDVRRVARAYLTEENRTCYALLPKGGRPIAPAASAAASPGLIRKVVLPNGLRLLLKEDHRLPFVEFRLAFGGGLLAETTLNNGITLLTSRMLLKGTARRSAEQIANEIEALGGHVSSFAGNNSFGLSLELLNPDAAKGIAMLADLLLQSSFPADELERERELQLAGLKSQRDRLLASAHAMMRRGLFGDGGYGLDPLGSEETVARLRREDLIQFLRSWAAPSNAVLAIFGDMDSEEVIAQVTQALAGWPAASAPPLAASKFTPEKPLRFVETRDKKQAVIVVGFPGGSIRDEDRFALDLLQEACSDLGSRLFMRVRDELGLAYYVGAQHFCGLEPGSFSFHAGT
jgi:zinc protease